MLNIKRIWPLMPMVMMYALTYAKPAKQDSARAIRALALANFYSLNPGVRVETNPVTGCPQFLWGDLFRYQNQLDPVDATYEFFEQNKDLYGITDPKRELKIISNSRRKDTSGPFGSLVILKQIYKGLEFHQSKIKVSFNRSEKLLSVVGGFVPIPKISTKPSIDSNSALTIVMNDLKLSKNYKDPIIESKERLTGRPSDWPPPPKLSIVNHKGKFYLAWVVRQPVGETFSDWEYFVDAQSGFIIRKEDLTVRDPASPPSGKQKTPFVPVQKNRTDSTAPSTPEKQ